jgi:Tfp pilus assembly protein PilN
MITINLYDYKRIIRDVGIQRHLAKVAAAIMVTLLISLGIWILQTMWIWKVESDLAEVQAEVAEATPDYNAVQHLKKQQGQYQKIITGIDKLRSDQARTTEFLEDIGQAVPEGVWLTSINQIGLSEVEGKKVPFLFISADQKSKRGKRGKGKKTKEPEDKFIELKGVGMDDQVIVHLLEQLRALPYIDAVVLNTSKRSWMENQPVQKFEVYCHFLKTKPAA